MDIEELENLTTALNSTDDEIYIPEVSLYERLFLELFTLIGLVSIAASFVTIFTIFKYKKLRSQLSNIILVHLLVLQSIFLFATPLTVRLSWLFELYSLVHAHAVCVLLEIDFVVEFAMVSFLYLLVSEWYIRTYQENSYQKFCRIYKFLIALIYLISLCVAGFTIPYCFKGMMFESSLLAVFFAGAIFVLLLVIVNVLHVIKKRRLMEKKNHQGLAIANIFVMVWCPAFVLTVLSATIEGVRWPVGTVLFFIMGFSSPIFGFFYLFYYSDDYNVFFKKIFRCQCSDYSNESLDDNCVIYNDVNGVVINKD